MRSPKISFIGAGSVVFTKNLLGDILSFPELQDCSISLYDIDATRLETAAHMARWTAQTPVSYTHLDVYKRQAQLHH